MRAADKTPWWLALRLPYLALESLDYAFEHPEPVLVADGQLIYCASAAALALGIEPGMAVLHGQLLARAHAAATPARVVTRKREAERQRLAQLADSLYCLTPHIEPYCLPDQGALEHSLLLELSQSERLFKGRQPLFDAARQIARAAGHSVWFGAGHTALASWLLARDRFEPSSLHHSPADYLAALLEVPVSALAAQPEPVARLTKMGFASLEDLWRQITSGGAPHYTALLRRCGRPFCDYLRAVFGEPTAPTTTLVRPVHVPRSRFSEEVEFDYPVLDCAGLWPAMEWLLERLGETLRKRQLQCHSLDWQMAGGDGIHYWQVRAERPQSGCSQLRDLSRIQLEALALPFAVHKIGLSCTELLVTGNPVSGDLFNLDRTADSAAREQLLARLKSRLGDAAITQIVVGDDHIPEHSQQPAPAAAEPLGKAAALLPGPRPTWLLTHPIALGNRPYWHGPLSLEQGPERIAAHWWDDPTERDYYLARRRDQVRCWIYYERRQRAWFVHGLFG